MREAYISLKDGEIFDIGGVSALVIPARPAGILLDAIAGGDVFRDPAHAVFIISKLSFCTKPTVISSFSTTALFQLWPTVPSQNIVSTLAVCPPHQV